MYALVITSIAKDDNRVLNIYAEQLPDKFNFIVIGDKKSPEKFNINNCSFYNIEQQEQLDFSLSVALPYNCYQRKNIGYLLAMRDGATTIYETDDDNLPYQNFFEEQSFFQENNILENNKLYNVYSWFSSESIWPRGFPLESIQSKQYTSAPKFITKKTFTPILQGLADLDPDVDAVYRMTQKLPILFDQKPSITLLNTYCPFNTQNTIHHQKVFPLLYIPVFCNFRVCDIWRSFVAQRICFEYGWGINFFAPTVEQKRNEHDLLEDFKDEYPGYIYNNQIIAGLKTLKLNNNEDKIYDNLISCYQLLIDQKYIGKDEMQPLTLWIKDCQTLLPS